MKLVFVMLILSAVGAFGGLFDSGDPGKERLAGQTGQQAADAPKNVIEKNGVRFEILVPDRVWTIPEKSAGRTAIRLALRITNKTDKPLRFSGYETLIPEVVRADGKELCRGGGDEPGPVNPEPFLGKETDYPLLLPGASTTFSIATRLSWRGGQLHFGLHESAVLADFNGLEPGRYKVRLVYESQDGIVQVNPGGKKIRGVWTGRVATPAVEVVLREREK
jgi:hypothetical protein